MAAVIGSMTAHLLVRVNDSEVINEIGTVEIPVRATGRPGSNAANEAVLSLDVDKADIARALRDAATTIDATLTPHLAGHIEVRMVEGRWSLTIDGEEFPWYIHEDGVTTTVDEDQLPGVTLTILAEHITAESTLPRRVS